MSARRTKNRTAGGNSKRSRSPKAPGRAKKSARSGTAPSRRRRAILLAGMVVLVTGLVASPWVWQEYRLQRAGQLLRNRRVDAALPWLEAALRSDPDRGAAHFLLARAARRQGRMRQVRERLQRAWDAGYDRQQIKREQWLAMAQTGQLDEAEPHLDELLADPQGDAGEICEAFVNGYLRSYRFQDALRLLDAWQADFPGDPQPHYCRALVWEHLMRRADAVEEYEAVLQMDPARTETRVRLADQLSSLHRYEEAGEHYRVSLQQDPDNQAARLGYAYCLMEQGFVEEPEQLFREVLAESPDDVRARVGLGSLALTAGNNQRAVEILSKVVAEQPTNLTARYKLASALQGLGRGDEATEHFEYVTAANKGLARVRALLESLRNDPQQISARLEAGQLLLKYGVSSEGVAWLQSIVEMQPDHREAHRALAEYYESRDMLDLAARHRERAGEVGTNGGETGAEAAKTEAKSGERR